MYGEPRKIREVAERLERRADGLRAEADALHTASEEVAWLSVAADRMRGHARDRRDEPSRSLASTTRRRGRCASTRRRCSGCST